MKRQGAAPPTSLARMAWGHGSPAPNVAARTCRWRGRTARTRLPAHGRRLTMDGGPVVPTERIPLEQTNFDRAAHGLCRSGLGMTGCRQPGRGCCGRMEHCLRVGRGDWRTAASVPATERAKKHGRALPCLIEQPYPGRSFHPSDMPACGSACSRPRTLSSTPSCCRTCNGERWHCSRPTGLNRTRVRGDCRNRRVL